MRNLRVFVRPTVAPRSCSARCDPSSEVRHRVPSVPTLDDVFDHTVGQKEQ